MGGTSLDKHNKRAYISGSAMAVQIDQRGNWRYLTPAGAPPSFQVAAASRSAIIQPTGIGVRVA